MTDRVTCPECEGSGKIPCGKCPNFGFIIRGCPPCPTCNGEKTVPAKKEKDHA